MTLAKILNVPNDKVRILTANVGGSFGMKNVNYPEYICILHAAKTLGRPVKWTDERSSSFLSDSHGRSQLMHAELALDADGKFLAVRLQGYGNLGAYITGVAPGPLSLNTGKNLASVYRTPLLGVDIKTVLTNTTLMGAYRGAGRPEANYYMERLIDRAASEMGINPLALRKRNFIKPAQMPFAAASGVTYDSGDFQGVFNKALEISDHANFAKRKKASRKEGKLRGIAVGSYLEVTAPPSGELGKITFEPDGSVKLTTGTLDYGQGHATPFAQVLSAQLGVPFEKVTLEQNDSDLVRFGNGTGGSRSITATGAAIVEVRGAGRLQKASRRRRIFWKPPKATSNSEAAASPSPAPTARSASWNWRSGCAKARCRKACRIPSTSITPPRIRRRPSPMAAMSRRSRSILIPACCGSCATPGSATSAPSSTR